jgi:hypothetical protein
MAKKQAKASWTPTFVGTKPTLAEVKLALTGSAQVVAGMLHRAVQAGLGAHMCRKDEVIPLADGAVTVGQVAAKYASLTGVQTDASESTGVLAVRLGIAAYSHKGMGMLWFPDGSQVKKQAENPALSALD